MRKYFVSKIYASVQGTSLYSRRVHASWLILWTSVGVLAGIGAAGLHPARLNTAWLVLAFSLLAISFISKRRGVITLVLIAGFTLGFYRGSLVQADLIAYQKYIGSQVMLAGQVSEDVSAGPQGDQRLKIKNIFIQGTTLDKQEPIKKIEGEIWLSTTDNVEIKRSDFVVVSGQLVEGFGNFPAAMFRAQIREVSRQAYIDPARDFRDWFAEKIRLAIKEPEASLGIGFLVGQRSALPEDLVENLRILGLTHIIVASGYNLTILVRLTRRLLSRISKYLAAVSAMFLTVGFILITGLSPSMTRAGLITSLSLAAWYFGRSINPFVLLGFAAGVTAFINPPYVWGDLGWYLSFTAFAGVIILSPLLIDYFWGNKKPNFILQIVSETTSAQIMTLPILALAFGQIAFLAIPANVLILPLIPFTMILTFGAGVFSALMPGIAAISGWPAEVVLTYMTKTADYMAGFPSAQGEVNFRIPVVILFYFIVAVIVWRLKRATKHNFAEDNIIE